MSPVALPENLGSRIKVTGHALTIKCTPPASFQLTQFLEGSWESAASWDHVAWHPPCGLPPILSLLGLRAVGGLLEGGLIRSTQNFLSVQWLGLCFHCQGEGSTPVWGTKPHKPHGTAKPEQTRNRKSTCDYKTLGPAVSAWPALAYLYPALTIARRVHDVPVPVFRVSLVLRAILSYSTLPLNYPSFLHFPQGLCISLSLPCDQFFAICPWATLLRFSVFSYVDSHIVCNMEIVISLLISYHIDMIPPGCCTQLSVTH